jgi:hypothetical protein
VPILSLRRPENEPPREAIAEIFFFNSRSLTGEMDLKNKHRRQLPPHLSGSRRVQARIDCRSRPEKMPGGGALT